MIFKRFLEIYCFLPIKILFIITEYGSEGLLFQNFVISDSEQQFKYLVYRSTSAVVICVNRNFLLSFKRCHTGIHRSPQAVNIIALLDHIPKGPITCATIAHSGWNLISESYIRESFQIQLVEEYNWKRKDLKENWVWIRQISNVTFRYIGYN